jgi:hypothetical protein
MPNTLEHMRDILAHMHACSDVQGKYISVILSEEWPLSKAVSPTTWVKNTDYRGRLLLPNARNYLSTSLSDLLHHFNDRCDCSLWLFNVDGVTALVRKELLAVRR